jgi:hypothetical protein
MTRMVITLEKEEVDAILALARRERRDPRQQAALCVRRDLERRGLLPSTDQQHVQVQTQQEAAP